MRLSELSRRSGMSTATIKFYLREGLLHPGRRITSTQADYDEEHLRRLTLIRALIQVGGISVADARAVLAAVDDASLDQVSRMGTAVAALPQVLPAPAPDDAEAVTADLVAREVQERLGWRVVPENPAHQALVSAVSALLRLGYPCDGEALLPYGKLAERLAEHELALIDKFAAPTTQLEAAVALTVLYEPVLLSLRRLAHAEQATRRLREDALPREDAPRASD
ncbi:MerR family transcriptional regulator [Streptomyces sp. 3MP-14]|uniref:MerR family transcriptional regulator n=1 Tax=Streptomyces mimosae TaxID=2586635 RepID=A0A5N5ZZ33_9ACTN|nr:MULTISPECIES: MerR family transcriptional regulator [Streptomyces]KAB8161525.1 MerR family transcriptional regulator [Streptomyces mimosae]KAB8173538.1 MerR family transcriptional regulator [Streptomyces sp. 3MP-14]